MTTSLLAPEKFEHSWRIAKMIAASQFAPKAFKGRPEDILIAMEYGQSVGLAPLPASQNIAVINGKPGLYGDGLLAVCSGRPDFEDMTETPLTDDKDNVMGYECTVKRKGREPVMRSFTIDDAKKAGLWGKQGPWTQYSSRMLQMRARGFALRDSFADALGGVALAEELEDYPKEKDITPNAIKDNLKALVDKNKEDNVSRETIKPGEIRKVNNLSGEIM